MQKAHYSREDLQNRGWTKSMVQRYLGKPDVPGAVSLWNATSVEECETREDWRHYRSQMDADVLLRYGRDMAVVRAKKSAGEEWRVPESYPGLTQEQFAAKMSERNQYWNTKDEEIGSQLKAEDEAERGSGLVCVDDTESF